MKEIESGNIAQMMHSSSAELLNELDEKGKKIRLTPVILVISTIILLLLIVKEANVPQLVLWIAFAVIAIWVARLLDAIRKTVVLFYDFDADLERAYGLLHDHAVNLASCSSVWHISASGKVHDRKYHAGASNLVERKRTKIERRCPDFMKTNIDTVAIDVGRQTLHLFPDRILVYDSGRVGAVGYEELHIQVTQKRFIEGEQVPSDTQVIDHTWQFVNKKGGPDKRFANNRQLPVCLYDELYFSSDSGVNEVIQVSRHGIGDGFVQAVRYLSQFTRSSLGQE